MQGRLLFDNDAERDRAYSLGIKDLNRKMSAEDMASGEVLFAATGVTDGNMLSGVKRHGDWVTTETVVMRSSTGTIRWIKARHNRPFEA
jgi:fructose-1,6-bisphosphatase II / sedoheptulose-1,7-bisphosphatase